MDRTGGSVAARAAARRQGGAAVKAALVVLVLAYVVLVVAGLVPADKRLGWLEFALIVLAALYAGGVLDGLREISVGAEGLKVVRDLEKRQERTEVDLLSLKIALTALVTKYENVHLERLEAPGPYLVHWGEIFFAQIERLDAVGYLDPISTRGFNAIREDRAANPGQEFDLKQYMRITDLGRTYLAKRREVEAAGRA